MSIWSPCAPCSSSRIPPTLSARTHPASPTRPPPPLPARSLPLCFTDWGSIVGSNHQASPVLLMVERQVVLSVDVLKFCFFCSTVCCVHPDTHNSSPSASQTYYTIEDFCLCLHPPLYATDSSPYQLYCTSLLFMYVVDWMIFSIIHCSLTLLFPSNTPSLHFCFHQRFLSFTFPALIFHVRYHAYQKFFVSQLLLSTRQYWILCL